MDLTIATYIKLAIIGLGILVGFSRQSSFSEANRLFWLFLLVAFAGEILESLMSKYFRNNFPLYHVFRPLYFILLTLALSEEMGRFKKLFQLTIPIVVIAALLNGLFFQSPIKELNTVIITLISIFLVLQVLFYIAILFEHYSWHETIYFHSFFICLGILINSISSFLTLGVYNFLEGDGQNSIILFLIISEWIFYSSFILNFVIQKKKPLQ
ncbi:hypothetical protein [Flavihumibacter profundi]|uniref:hypothetical protein n=1 Tax=Flavihumibacter profundi TaxID=2716883 RepID=UPI001CC6B8BC|nr:hypothetical protein [Flavihumibacter profundi]MBZ5857037.1 hypothetical protein [Flavihumibacter profundi]